MAIALRSAIRSHAVRATVARELDMLLHAVAPARAAM